MGRRPGRLALCAALCVLAVIGAPKARAGEQPTWCRLGIALAPGPRSPARFDPIGAICVRLPREAISVRALEPGGGHWRTASTRAEAGKWVYCAWNPAGKPIRYKRTEPVTLGRLAPGTYVIDFMPGKRTGSDFAWVLPKVVECDLRADRVVTLELDAVRPVRVDGQLVLGVGGNGRRGTRIVCLDVTGGHTHPVTRAAADARGRFSLSLYPTRQYRLIAQVGLGGSRLVQEGPTFRPEDYRAAVLQWRVDTDDRGAGAIVVRVDSEGERVAYTEHAEVVVRGEKSIANLPVKNGRYEMPVFKGVEEDRSYLVAGHTYRVAIGVPPGDRYYIGGPASFRVPEPGQEPFVFELLLAPKPELQVECVDATTGQALNAYSLVLSGDAQEAPSLVFRSPAKRDQPWRLRPGHYEGKAMAGGYAAKAVVLDVPPRQARVPLKVALEPLGRLRVRLRGPDGELVAGRAELYVPGNPLLRPGAHAHMGADGTVTIPCNRGARAVLRASSAGLAPVLVPIEPGQDGADVRLGRGTELRAQVHLAGQLLSARAAGGLALVALEPRPLLYDVGLPDQDGIIALRVLPGQYRLYLVLTEVRKGAYHIDDLRIEGPTERSYRFRSPEALEPKRVRDPLVAPVP
jgi:hypothetical protein